MSATHRALRKSESTTGSAALPLFKCCWDKNSGGKWGWGGNIFFCLKVWAKTQKQKACFLSILFCCCLVLAVLSSNLCEIIQGGWFFSLNLFFSKCYFLCLSRNQPYDYFFVSFIRIAKGGSFRQIFFFIHFNNNFQYCRKWERILCYERNCLKHLYNLETKPF